MLLRMKSDAINNYLWAIRIDWDSPGKPGNIVILLSRCGEEFVVIFSLWMWLAIFFLEQMVTQDEPFPEN